MNFFVQKTSSLIAIFAAVAALAGCAANQAQPQTKAQTQEEHKAHHPEGDATRPSSGAGQGGAGGSMSMMGQGSGGQMGMMGQGGQMDMKSMCEMHDKMKAARTPAERSAMMDERMKNMSPEMKQRHMETMQQQCK